MRYGAYMVPSKQELDALHKFLELEKSMDKENLKEFMSIDKTGLSKTKVNGFIKSIEQNEKLRTTIKKKTVVSSYAQPRPWLPVSQQVV